jgi:long-subunit acyl-CoA synthetase (AMP-forming)
MSTTETAYVEQSAMKRQSLINFFYEKEAMHPDQPYLHQPFGDRWETYSWGEVGNRARRIANYLIQVGLTPGTKVGLVSSNCREWIIADLAIMMAECVSVPFFPTLSGDQLAEVIELGDVELLFVGKTTVWEDMKTGVPKDLKVVKFPHYQGNDPIDIGEDWNKILAETPPLEGTPSAGLDDLWTIIFTSGTTGTPKGVMHDYNNVCETIDFNLTFNPCHLSLDGNNRFFSYLPLNHIAERCYEMIGIALGAEVFFTESLDRFPHNLKEAKPNNFFAVPRIWTKFMQAILMQLPQKRLNVLLKTPVVSGLIKKKIATGLGLQNSVNNMSGAAPIPQSTKDWYASLGLPITEVYGMTENFGSCTFLGEDAVRPRSVGKPNSRAELEIDPESGEILMRAPWVMKGYYKSPELTAETIVDGWLHTGDQGELDEDGYLYITGRVKDTFKTSKGEFIIPSALEDHFGSSDDIETMCLLGLGIPQPVLIVSLSEAGASKSQSDIFKCLEQTRLNVNQQLHNYEHVSAIVIAKKPFSVEDGTLTPTLKVKRTKVHEVYRDRLHDFCVDEATVIFE